MRRELILPILIGLLVTIASGHLLVSEVQADDSEASGEDRAGWLGLVVDGNRSADDSGLSITTVLRRSPAHRAGLKEGDRIHLLNGRDASTATQFDALAEKASPGETLSVKVTRDGNHRRFDLLVDEARPPAEVLRLHHVGYFAPALTIDELDRGNLPLRPIADKPLVIEFWATWCTVCEHVSRRLDDAREQFPDAFDVLSVTAEEPTQVREYLKDSPKPQKVGIDGDRRAHEAFLVQSYPFIVVIGTDNRVQAVTTRLGEVDDIIADLVDD